MLPLRRLSLSAHTNMCVKNLTAKSRNRWPLSAALIGHQYEHPSSADWRQSFSCLCSGTYSQRLLHGSKEVCWLQLYCRCGEYCGVTVCPQHRQGCRRQTASGRAAKDRHLVRPAYVHSRPEFGATSRSGDGEY